MMWNTTFSKAKWKNHVSHLPHQPEFIEQLLLPEQLMMIAGKFGIGKTMELLHLLFCFSYGGTWHGLTVEPATAFYIAWEGDPVKLNKRMEIIEAQYAHLGQKYPYFIRMSTKSIPLDTQQGREEIVNIVQAMDEKPRVILADPFKRTVSKEYMKPAIADAWIEGASFVARELGCAVISSNHTNKITYRRNEPPDVLSADRVKGAGDLLDGVSSAILIAEEMGSRRVTLPGGFSKVEWGVLSTVIKVLKAKDATGEFPLLQVSLDRKLLKLDGEKWMVDSNGDIKVV